MSIARLHEADVPYVIVLQQVVMSTLPTLGVAAMGRRMPLAELQRRLGLADPTAHLRPRSNGIKAEPELDEQPAGAEADQREGENGAAGPPLPDGGATDVAAPQPGDATAAADTLPGDPAAAPEAVGAAAYAAATPDSAVAAGALIPELDAGVAPVHELYEALLRVLLQVQSYGTLS